MILNHPNLPNWQPPDDFQPVASAIEGVSVFAPRPPESKVDHAHQYLCPNCGASTGYDVRAGGIACEYCGYTAIAAASGAAAAQQSVAFEFTLNTLKKVEQGWGISRQVTHCDSCGGDFSTEAGNLTATCTFCGSNKVNTQTIEDDHLRPRWVIPFKVEKTALQQAIKQWLGNGWMHPGGLIQAAGIEKRIAGIYLPFWAFDATIMGTWKAEVGYDKTETYYSNGERRTRTVTKWHWRTGNVVTPISDLLVPGTDNISNRLLNRLYPFHLSALQPYHPDFLAGWQAQAYEVSLTDGWNTAKENMREQARERCEKDHDGDRIRNFSMNADFRDETWRYMLLPVYLASYRFDDKPYQVLVNGQTGQVVGQKPVAWWKIWLAIAAMFSPALCFAIVGLPLLIVGVGALPLLLAAVVFILAIIGAVWLYNQAAESEAE